MICAAAGCGEWHGWAASSACGTRLPLRPCSPNSLIATGESYCTVRLIHLVRHGRTVWNTQKRVMGWLDVGIEPTSQPDAESGGTCADRRGCRLDRVESSAAGVGDGGSACRVG